MSNAFPSAVEKPYKLCAYLIYGFMVTVILLYAFVQMLHNVFVPQLSAATETYSTWNDWGSLPSFALHFEKIKGTWAHVDVGYQHAEDVGDGLTFYGLRQTGAIEASVRKLDEYELEFFTECLSPTFPPLGAINYVNNNEIELSFSMWPDDFEQNREETWLTVQLSAFHTSQVAVSDVGERQPLIQVPISPCADRIHEIPSISLRKVILERSCTDSPLDFTRCKDITYEKEFNGQFKVANEVWPTRRVPYGATYPRAPENKTLYCGAAHITIDRREVSQVRIPPTYARLLTVLSRAGGLISYVGMVFAFLFVPKFTQKVVPLTLRFMLRKENDVVGEGNDGVIDDGGDSSIQSNGDDTSKDDSTHVVEAGIGGDKSTEEGNRNDTSTDDSV